MTKLSGRELAVLALNRIESNDAYANLALTEVLRENAAADKREKAFATELVYGVVRNRLKLDYLLNQLLARPLKQSALTVKNVLRLSLYQLIYMKDIPERAVLHSAVEYVKNSKFSGLSGVTNAVLRNYLRGKTEIKLTAIDERLSLEYSMPLWLVQRWLNLFGNDITEQILRVSNQRAPLSVRVNTHLTTVEAAKTALTAEGFTVLDGAILEEALQLENLPDSLEKSPSFIAGHLFPQDESSMLCARLLQPQPGETVIDMCAAPGGKSTHLAQLMQNRGSVCSVDIYPHKAELIAQNAKRLKLDCIKPQVGDGTTYSLPDGSLADRILVDAPCSGTGVFRRRADSKYRKTPEDITSLVSLQREILDNAARQLKPGGVLVFSTCSLEPEEDEEQITRFLRDYPQFELEDYRDFLPQAVQRYAWQAEQKWLKVLPSEVGGDGFFLCRMRKNQ